jgi:hypothetical protein
MVEMLMTMLISHRQVATAAAAEYAFAPDVVCLPMQDGSVRLLDLGGHFYAISAIGAAMLKEMFERGTAGASQHLAGQYSVDIRQVQKDLAAFLRNLERHRLLYRRHARWRIRRPATALSCLLVPLLYGVRRGVRSLHGQAWMLLALAHLSCWLFGLTRTIAVWKRCYGPAYGYMSAEAAAEPVRAIDAAVRQVAAAHVFQVECKERALCCWALARAAGVPAALVIGVSLFPVQGHCWCEYGTWTFSDERDWCEMFMPVARYT